MSTRRTMPTPGEADVAAERVAPPLHAVCPLCHTADPLLSDAALAAGGEWICATCSAHWNAVRMAKVAAYRAWTRERRPDGAHAVTHTG